MRQFVVVCVTAPDDALVTPLVGLKNSGANVLVILPDPATFPGNGATGRAFIDALHAAELDASTSGL